MKAMLVFESMFGNTQQIARAIGEGLEPYGDVTLVEVGTAGPPPEDLDLLVVGGPTHAFGMSRATTRQDAARQAHGPLISQGIGIREWLDGLPRLIRPVTVAAFDTKMGKPSWLPGSAGRSAAGQLKRHGVRAAIAPESFYVEAVTGPLSDGELDRARRWGTALGESLHRTVGQRRTQ